MLPILRVNYGLMVRNTTIQIHSRCFLRAGCGDQGRKNILRKTTGQILHCEDGGWGEHVGKRLILAVKDFATSSIIFHISLGTSNNPGNVNM
jgi:hypothetical protein